MLRNIIIKWTVTLSESCSRVGWTYPPGTQSRITIVWISNEKNTSNVDFLFKNLLNSKKTPGLLWWTVTVHQTSPKTPKPPNHLERPEKWFSKPLYNFFLAPIFQHLLLSETPNIKEYCFKMNSRTFGELPKGRMRLSAWNSLKNNYILNFQRKNTLSRQTWFLAKSTGLQGSSVHRVIKNIAPGFWVGIFRLPIQLENK